MQAGLGATEVITKRRPDQICILDRSLPHHVQKGFKHNGFSDGLVVVSSCLGLNPGFDNSEQVS